MQILTELELKDIYDQYFEKGDELVLKQFPSKQKKQHGVCLFIVKVLDPEKVYTEKEINEVLKPVYDDFVMIRRYLVDLGLISRKPDGSAYWVNV
ncbi:DUF2087 domain-containing protein [Paracholeplasma manati]|uniref:DUF2087 domain-containing protein n=1 Tax=Paracholeplasma manati TaxID=591373 RepID=A0ABT2Y7V2_9MOLU|nr:DUF2087 domain-containing protein [Paracholeplasma manati]MCV2232824.1 DUF2087 domain-containing protein [Paracholeplasma manati]MDG0889656.1 DUF2087 domain-containing protein [Paracholeplasma manati]